MKVNNIKYLNEENNVVVTIVCEPFTKKRCEKQLYNNQQEMENIQAHFIGRMERRKGRRGEGKKREREEEEMKKREGKGREGRGGEGEVTNLFVEPVQCVKLNIYSSR